MKRILILVLLFCGTLVFSQKVIDTAYKSDIRSVSAWDSIRVAYKDSTELVHAILLLFISALT